MSSGLIDSSVAAHPLVRLADELEAVLDDAAGSPAWTLLPSELAAVLPRLAVLKNRIDAVELRLLREADRHQVGDPSGHANTAGWWAATTRTTKPAAHQRVALAARLDQGDTATTVTAVERGTVSLEQAAVIVHAVDALPSAVVGAEVRGRAEVELVALAAHHDPKDLRRLGRRILEVVAPDLAEEKERKILEDEERHAAATASFSIRHDGHGSVYGRFKIPVLAGEMLVKHLAALAAPKHQRAGEQDPTAPPTPVSRPLRLGQAFVEYIETRAAEDTPAAGGLAATVVVTMTMESLLGGQAAATLDSGARISAAEARRLACEAGLIPAVLGSPSQVLDLGRKNRFHTGPQRIAMGLRDRGCAAQHCDWPPSMCHAHHATPWARGGGTSVKDGMLLCPRHHALAHDARYQLKSGPDGKVGFSRRT